MAPSSHSEVPLFSVVVPVYNRGRLVRDTLSSVAAQSFADWECVVVDDGSDDSSELRTTVESFNDARFRLMRTSNGGGGSARNRGVQAARGRYIAFLDSDDAFMPDKLAELSRVVTESETAVYYSQALVDRGSGIGWRRPSRHLRAGENVSEFLFVENEFIQTSTLVVPRSLALSVPWAEDLPHGQDLDFVLRLWATGAEFVALPRPLTVWRDVTESGRTSRARDVAQQELWLARMAPLLSQRAVAGYRATVQAYFVAQTEPWSALAFIVRGMRAGVSLRVSVRQVLRSFLPRRVYRALVNAFVLTGGEAITLSPREGASAGARPKGDVGL